MSSVRFPSIKDVASGLAGIKRSLGDDIPETDVRLQVMSDGMWCIHSGDSSYDQDHRGHWGESSIDRKSNCRDLARDLIEQAKEHAAQDKDYDTDEQHENRGAKLSNPAGESQAAEGEQSPTQTILAPAKAIPAPSAERPTDGTAPYGRDSVNVRTDEPSNAERAFSIAEARKDKGACRAYRKALRRIGVPFPLSGSFHVLGPRGNVVAPGEVTYDPPWFFRVIVGPAPG